MTLTRRIALFIATILLLALGGALVVHTLAARNAVQQQQDARNRDTAAALALALSQQHGDPVALAAVAAAQFDLGHYRRITLRSPKGDALIALEQAPPPDRAPAWFVRWLPVAAVPGTAIVSNGWTELGTLAVESHTAWAQEALWQAATQTAWLLAALAALAGVLTTVLLHAWQRPLAATVAQARSLEEGHFIEAPEPELPELRELTRSMNTMVRRLHEVFATQASQVAFLQRQAQLDAATGLPLRRQFQQTLTRALAQPTAWRPGLLLLRLPQLDQVNQRHGRDAADALLRRVGDALLGRMKREPDLLACRLGGGDFALLLPLPGLAALLLPEVRRAVVETLSDGLGDDAPRPLFATVERVDADSAEQALGQGAALLDLARQQADRVCMLPAAPGTAPLPNLATLYPRIGEALASQRVRLGEYEVLDREGRLMHLECPLRLQFEADGPYEPAAHWLAAARRGGLLPMVDTTAIRLALYAISLDRRPRAVNVELSSLREEGFVTGVAAMLRAAGAAARKLSIEWVADLPGVGAALNDGRGGDLSAAAHAIEAWGGSGVRMGAEHAGAAPEQLARLRDLGFDYVKVDARHLRGAAQDNAVQAYARSLVGLIRLLGMQALAEGVDDTADLALLWQLGFDGATGRAVGAGGRRPPPQPPVPAATSDALPA